MNTRSMYAMLGVLALVVIGLIVYNQSQNTNSLESTNQAGLNANTEPTDNTTEANLNINDSTPTSGSANINTSVNNNTSGQLSDESDLDNGQVYQIAFDGNAYTPANLTLKAGDTVVFKNNSDRSFWPASAPHPQHTNYPEFDAKKAIAPDQSFQFKFLKTGDWGFHDHLRPSVFGKITVQ